ncbi:hypothetical protein EMCRGX_G017665 [Ephydatia muelleri]
MDKVSDQDDDKVDAKCKKEIKHLTTVYSLINSIANTTCICGEQEQLNTVTQQMKIQILIGNGRQPHAHISHQVKPLHEGTLLLHLLPHGHTAPERGAGAAIGQRDQCPGPRGLRRVQQPEGGVGRYGAKNGAEIELAGSVYEEKLFDLKTKNIVLDVSAINQAPEIQRRLRILSDALNSLKTWLT